MTDDLIWSADRVRDLLQRIHAHLEENFDPVHSKGTTFHPRHHATILAQAEDALEDLAIRAGLWGPPRTVSRTTDWDKVDATTDEEIDRQIKEDGTEPLDKEWFEQASRTLPEPPR